MAKTASLPNTPKWVDDLFHDVLSANPEISVSRAAKLMIDHNPEVIVYIYRKKQGDSLSPKEVRHFMGVKSKTVALSLYRKLLSPGSRMEIDTGAFTRMKHRLNTRGKIVFGASSIGYVALKDMNFDRAARWAYPRLKQQMHESMHWGTAATIMRKGASNTHDRNIAKSVAEYVRAAADYENLKLMTEAILARG